MAGNVNKVLLIGRVGQDPEGRVGNGPARLSLATAKRWRDKNGEQRERTTWHQIVTFREPLIDLIENHVKKGALIYVEGELTSRSYEKNGAKHWVTEILVDFGGTIQFVEGRTGGGRPNDAESYGARAGGRSDSNGQYDMSHDEESAHAGRDGSRGNYQSPLSPPPGYDPNRRPRTTMDDPPRDFVRELDDEIPF